MKKIITLIALFTLIFVASSPIVSLRFNVDASQLNIEATSNYVGTSPQLKVMFSSPSDLSKGDEIEIKFDEKVSLIREDLVDRVFINGESPLKISVVGSNTIRILLFFGVVKNEKLEIIISKGVIQNPNEPGYYKLTLNINGKQYFSSYYYVVDITTVHDVNLKILNNGFKIQFTVGNKGALEGYKPEIISIGNSTILQVNPKDLIFIRFSPILSELFSSLSFREISVNGTNPPLNPTLITHFEDTSKEEKEISIVVPKNINIGSEVEIIIKEVSETISVPNNLSGYAFVKVWTTKETTPVESNHTEIKSQNFITTLINITPEESDGENDFYISNPTVELSWDKGNSIEKVETFISIDGKDFQTYTDPITFDDGIHTLNYYSTGYSGKKLFKEDIKEFTLKVDTTSPVINIISPLVTDNRIYTLKVDISDDNLKEVSVQLGSITFYPYKHNFEIPTVLFQNETQFEIKAVDFAGHISEYKNVIKLN